MSATDETEDERFRRVAALFVAAGFLDTLGIRLERSVPARKSS